LKIGILVVDLKQRRIELLARVEIIHGDRRVVALRVGHGPLPQFEVLGAELQHQPVGADELLFLDGQSRKQPYLCVLTAPLKRAGIANNIDLSSRRADNVIAYLESQGVNPNIISAKGFGDTHPVASNDTPDGRAKNRRIEIVLEGPGA